MADVTVGSVIAYLKLETSNFAAGIAKARQDLGVFSTACVAIGDGFVKFGSQLSLVFTAPIVSAVTAAIHAGGEFEGQLNRISALGGITGESLTTLGTAAKDLVKTFKTYTATEIASGMADLAAAGLDATKIYEAMPGVLQLAKAGELGVSDAATFAVRGITQFGLAMTDTSHLADVYAKAAASGLLTTKQMADAMGFAGPMASSLGMTLEQTASILTIFSNSGLAGAKGGTALRSILNSLIKPTKDAQDVFDKLNISLKDSAGKMRPVADIMQELHDKGASTAQVFQIFNQMGGSAALTLMNTGKPAIDAMTESLVNAGGAAKAMADTMGTGTTASLASLKAGLNLVVIELKESLGPYIQKGIEWLQGLLEKVQALVTWFNGLSEGWKDTIVVIAGFVAALGPCLVVLGTLIKTVGLASQAFMVLTSGPVAAVAAIAALTAGIIYFIKNQDNLLEKTTGVWHAVVVIIKGVLTPFEVVGKAIGAIIFGIVQGFEKIIAVVKTAIEWFNKWKTEANTSVNAAFPTGGGVASGKVMSIGGHAAGGYFTTPHIAQIAENEPEWVVPQSRAAEFAGQMGEGAETATLLRSVIVKLDMLNASMRAVPSGVGAVVNGMGRQ